MSDLVATWPKKRPLAEYLANLEDADRDGQVINYRISRPPRVSLLDWSGRPKRLYMVYDGYVRGYNEIIGIGNHDEHVVSVVGTEDYWPGGWYIVRDPEWHPISPSPMKGFQGWRYFEPIGRQA